MFTADNLQGVEKDKRHLQMRKLSKKGDAYTLDVYVKKRACWAFLCCFTIIQIDNEYL
ncbi:hypothetical protein FC72_GL001065 [Companilactobacillus tucceti DSM 20183]|uniref:Uncharacterized protein n=1 Tax=Companilactobacillus tucceti DSM 20183 TaxID=1423811 RepID=A0A0R1J4U0_9LACO|nr:hypothetical protein FC72_GL001065 [Companilactobacillus tucceti DSM 20183]